MIQHINVSQASKLLKEDPSIKLIDVRELPEFNYCHLDNAILCPLSQFEQSIKAANLQFQNKIILYCHHGVRSAKAAYILSEMGFENLFTMDGGIDAWSLELDSTIPLY